jgi:hypothetical protein
MMMMPTTINQSIPFLTRVTEFYKKDKLVNRLFMENLEIVQTVLLAYTTQMQKHENSLSLSLSLSLITKNESLPVKFQFSSKSLSHKKL